MKIGIDIRSTLKKTTGIGKYTLNLVTAISKVDSQNNYYLYSRKKILDFKRRLPKLPAANFFHCVDYFRKGPNAVLPDIDVLHTSSYDLERPRRVEYIVTIHDVIIKAYPYGHSDETIREMDEKLRRVLSEADILVADSFNTKSDLMKFYDIPDTKISVIYPGIYITNDELPRTEQFITLRWSVLLRRTTNYGEYILFVGTLEPRKNVDGLIRAFDWLKKESGIKHKLYIVGMKGWMSENIFKMYEESEFKKDIVFKGYVSDEELVELYKKATVFVYPSFYEGFGFPIVEAFSYGLPVVTSKTSSCGEIAGDSALLIDPSDYRAIGEAILKLVNDKNLREEFSKRGINRAKEFTWTRTAKEFVELFKNDYTD